MQQVIEANQCGPQTMRTMIAGSDQVENLINLFLNETTSPEEEKPKISVAVHRSPKQTSISGSSKALKSFAEYARNQGMRSVPTNIAGGFHSGQFEGITSLFEDHIKSKVSDSKIGFQMSRRMFWNFDGKSFAPLNSRDLAFRLASMLVKRAHLFEAIKNALEDSSSSIEEIIDVKFWGIFF
jgi:malonyl CoA-acyl carrier protein transacylase